MPPGGGNSPAGPSPGGVGDTSMALGRKGFALKYVRCGNENRERHAPPPSILCDLWTVFV